MVTNSNETYQRATRGNQLIDPNRQLSNFSETTEFIFKWLAPPKHNMTSRYCHITH